MRGTAATPIRPCLAALVLAAAMLLGWTLWRGQDVNWDWQNYHLYDVLALLHGRLDADVAPGGPQSFLNPLPYLVPYLARRLLPPVVAGLAVGASQLLPVVACWAIGWRLWGDRPDRALVAGTGALCACTGAVVLTEAGTSFSDVTLAALPLFGLFVILPRREGDQASSARLGAAGALLGAAVGLKPTGLFTLPGLWAAAAVAAPAGGSRLRRLAAASAGAAVGSLASDGAWALHLWRAFGNPLFPFMNAVFRSPSAVPIDFADPRYHWQGGLHALGLPFRLAVGTDATSEIAVRDLRLALALPIALAALLWPRHRVWPRHRAAPATALRMAAAWLVAGSGSWLVLDPVQRYAAPLEMLAAVVTVVAAARLVRRFRVAGLAAVLALLTLTTRPADFFHRPWGEAFAARVPEGVPADATYGLLTQPLAYWVAQAPRPAHAFTLMSGLLPDDGALQRRLDRIIDKAGARLWLLNLDHPVDAMVRAEMARHRLVLAPPCLRTPNMVWIDSVFCRGERSGPRADAASDLALNDAVSFSRAGTGMIYEMDGWEATEGDGTWASGPRASLAFHPAAGVPVGPTVLVVTTGGIGGAPPRHVAASAGGGTEQRWIMRPGETATHRLCVGDRRGDGDVVRVWFETDDVRSLASLGVGTEPRPLAFRILDMRLVADRAGGCGAAAVRPRHPRSAPAGTATPA